jgi:phosphomannomutase
MDGGVIITASHNPPQYNGIKAIWSDGIEISHEQEDVIETFTLTEKKNWQHGTSWAKPTS